MSEFLDLPSSVRGAVINGLLALAVFAIIDLVTGPSHTAPSSAAIYWAAGWFACARFGRGFA